MPACNLIIDSCCDLPFDVVDREGIELIEFPYIAGDGEHSDDMYRSRSAHDFFDSMRNGANTTTISAWMIRHRCSCAISAGLCMPTWI